MCVDVCVRVFKEVIQLPPVLHLMFGASNA